MKNPFISLTLSQNKSDISINVNHIACVYSEGPRVTVQLTSGKYIEVIEKYHLILDFIDNVFVNDLDTN